MRRDVYSGRLRLNGEEHRDPHSSQQLRDVLCLKRFEEAKALLRKTMPVARRVLGESTMTHAQDEVDYARALYERTTRATLDDLREAVTTLEDTERIARRVLGGAHPVTEGSRKICKTREQEARPMKGAVGREAMAARGHAQGENIGRRRTSPPPARP